LSLVDGEFMEEIAAASLVLLQEFQPQALSNTAWSLAQLQFAYEPLLDALSRHAVTKIDGFRVLQ